MTDLFWPGDQLAGTLMSDAAFLDALVAVEQAWLDGLVAAGVAPPQAAADLAGYLTAGDLEPIACGADADGNALRTRPHAGCTAVLPAKTSSTPR